VKKLPETIKLESVGTIFDVRFQVPFVSGKVLTEGEFRFVKEMREYLKCRAISDIVNISREAETLTFTFQIRYHSKAAATEAVLEYYEKIKNWKISNRKLHTRKGRFVKEVTQKHKTKIKGGKKLKPKKAVKAPDLKLLIEENRFKY
jgi:hypothetical protein